MIVHIDCNSFYASVEIALHPEVKGRPVVVANDNEAGGGIILALSPEAKKIGLKRGNPIFKVRHLLKEHDVTLFPADLRKYQEVSRKIMEIVIEQDIVLNFVQYSIDEFFGYIPIDDPVELHKYVEAVAHAIVEGSGVPVSCGCSTTYTLAKTATWFAKNFKAYNGICILPIGKKDTALRKIQIEKIWGIGRANTPKLKKYGINTAFDFAQLSESNVNLLMTTSGIKTWKELNGIPSIDLTSEAQKRSIMHSRTFAYMISDFEVLKENLCNYITEAAAKLRKQQSVCQELVVFIATNRHRLDLAQYSNSASMHLSTKTSNTMILYKASITLLRQIYRQGYKYKRLGVILNNIDNDCAVQLNLFDNTDHKKFKQLMRATDGINSRYGLNTVRLSMSSPIKEYDQSSQITYREANKGK